VATVDHKARKEKAAADLKKKKAGKKTDLEMPAGFA
jgi:hypothetical protein